MSPSQRKTPSYKHIMVCLRPKWWHHHINILYCVALQEWDTIIKTHYIVSPFKRETPSYKNIISDKTFDSFIIIVSPSQRETPLYKHIISNLPEWANLLSYVYRSFVKYMRTTSAIKRHNFGIRKRKENHKCNLNEHNFGRKQ